jgi:2-oxoglutarate ferredoxin oxidoreductase subunit alpha
VRSLWLAEGRLEEHNRNLQRKYDEIRKNEIMCEEVGTEDADIVLVAYGVAARIVRSAVEVARDEGIKAGLIRPITLWPFPSEHVRRAAKESRTFLVVEMNMGQMVEDVRLAVEGQAAVKFHGRPGGGVPTVEEILEKIREVAVPSSTASR